jgi:hypothetical protein
MRKSTPKFDKSFKISRGQMHRIVKYAIGGLILIPTLAFSQNFPLVAKKVVTIKRMLPPTVNLNKKRIKIESRVEASVHIDDGLPALLKTKLVTMIQKDPRFIVEEVQPETILRFAVTNFYTEKWTGGSGQAQIEEYRGKLEVAYQAVEVRTGATLDSENLLNSIGYDPPKGPSILGNSNPFAARKSVGRASENLVRDDLIDGIVFQMGKRVAPVEEPEEVLLPGGKLEPLSSLAMNHRWGTLEEQAEKMDKFPKPLDDTYRVYLLALAKEAEAYDLAREANERELGKRPDISKDEADAQFRRAQKYMDEARKLYQEIVEANPKERNFRPGDARTEEAVVIYATIVRYQEELKKNLVSLSSAGVHAAGDRAAMTRLPRF